MKGIEIALGRKLTGHEMDHISYLADLGAEVNGCVHNLLHEMWKAGKKQAQVKSINELVQEAHQNAISKGWWEEDRSFGELIALMHSELSEALEDHRNHKGMNEVWYEYPNGRIYEVPEKDILIDLNTGLTKSTLGKPCGIPSELADVVIRVFDACGRHGIDLEQAIAEKMAYNATRPHKHGGKAI